MGNRFGQVLHSWILKDGGGKYHRIDVVPDEDASISDFREPGMANVSTMALFGAPVDMDRRGVDYQDEGVTAHDTEGFLADMCMQAVDDACACAYARQNPGSWAIVDSWAAGGPVAVSLTGYDDDRIYPEREDALEFHEDAVELPDGMWVGLDAGDEVCETAEGEGAMADRVRLVSGEDADEAEALLESAGVAVSRLSQDSGAVVALKQDVLKQFEGTSWRGPDGKPVPVTEDNWREVAASVISEEMGVVEQVVDGEVYGLVHLSAHEVEEGDPWCAGWVEDDSVWGFVGYNDDAELLEAARWTFDLPGARVIAEEASGV